MDSWPQEHVIERPNTNKNEQNYSQLDKEALGIIYGVKRFHSYIYGRKWTLLTDHKPLTSILHPEKSVPSMAAARLQRWALLLGAYTYDIQYRNTKDHSNADFMSRCPLKSDIKDKPDTPSLFMLTHTEPLPVTNDEIQRKTRSDQILGKVVSMLQSGHMGSVGDSDIVPFMRRREELSLWNGCIMWGVRIVIPSCLRSRLLQELHTAHLGVVKMKKIARSFIWWPGIDSDIEQIAAKCSTCQQSARMPSKAPIHPWLYPSSPWQRIHVDYAGPVENKMLLIVVDAHSKWLEVIPMKTTTTEATISALQGIFSRWGLPEHLHSDNGPQFVSSEFESFMRGNGILHTRSAPYHPQSNGLAERYVQTVKRALKADSHTPFQLRLDRFLLTFRSAPSSTTQVSPSELMIGRPVRTRLTLVKPNIRRHVQQQQSRMITPRREREFEEGENVYVREFGRNRKWTEGTVTKRAGVSYDIQLPSGHVSRHADQMRKMKDDTHDTRAESGDTHDTRPESGDTNDTRPESDENFDVTAESGDKYDATGSSVMPSSCAEANSAVPSPAVAPGRSTRVRKAPDRLGIAAVPYR